MNKDFDNLLASAKLRLLKMHFDSKLGHLGGNLSCFDSLMTLHHFNLNKNDRFILSKGHSAGALYITLWTLGLLNDSDLESFCKDNTRLPAHPSGDGIPGLLFSTGSLGHGPSLAAGLALAAKYRENDRQIFCLCSDGEWQEGSCWESLIFSVHHKLNNLTIMIDQNGLQGFGTTEDVISCSNLTPRLKAFDAHVLEIDGHNPKEISSALNDKSKDKPNIIVLNTLKGKGLHNEGKLECHYLPLNQDQYQAAQNQIKKSCLE